MPGERLVITVDARMSYIERSSVATLLAYLNTGHLVANNETNSDTQQATTRDLFAMARFFRLVALESLLVADRLRPLIQLDTVSWVLETAMFFAHPALTDECLAFMDQRAPKLVERQLLRTLAAPQLIAVLGRDSFCASESDVVRSVMDWFAFNSNRTDIEQEHLGVFECIRLTLLPDKELDRILISMRQLPAAQSLVIDAKEANEYAAQAQQRQTAIRFKRGTVLRSECRAQLMAASGAAPAWILRLGNPALVNFVKMRADGVGYETKLITTSK